MKSAVVIALLAVCPPGFGAAPKGSDLQVQAYDGGSISLSDRQGVVAVIEPQVWTTRYYPFKGTHASHAMDDLRGAVTTVDGHHLVLRGSVGPVKDGFKIRYVLSSDSDLKVETVLVTLILPQAEWLDAAIQAGGTEARVTPELLTARATRDEDRDQTVLFIGPSPAHAGLNLELRCSDATELSLNDMRRWNQPTLELQAKEDTDGGNPAVIEENKSWKAGTAKTFELTISPRRPVSFSSRILGADLFSALRWSIQSRKVSLRPSARPDRAGATTLDTALNGALVLGSALVAVACVLVLIPGARIRLLAAAGAAIGRRGTRRSQNGMLRSLRIAKGCWAVLTGEQGAVLIPILAMVCLLLIDAGVMGATASLCSHMQDRGIHGSFSWILGFSSDHPFLFKPLLRVSLFGHRVAAKALTLGLDFVTLLVYFFFYAILVVYVFGFFTNERVTLRESWRVARSRWTAISSWSVVFFFTGWSIESYDHVAPWLKIPFMKVVLGGAWSLMTFFVIPVVVFEGRNLMGSIRRSQELFRQTWIEQVFCKAGLWGSFLAVIACLLSLYSVNHGLPHWEASGAHALRLVLPNWEVGPADWEVWLYLFLGVCFSVIFSGLRIIFNTVLYSYGITGMLPDELRPPRFARGKARK